MGTKKHCQAIITFTLIMDGPDPVPTTDAREQALNGQARDSEKSDSPSAGSATPPQTIHKEEPPRKIHGIKARQHLDIIHSVR